MLSGEDEDNVEERQRVIVVDAMNVRGCVPDGWWRDPDAALVRLVEAIAGHEWGDEWVLVVADGRPIVGAPAGTRGQVELRYAGHCAPDAADDVIVDVVIDDDSGVTVVTSDRGLIARLPAAATVQGAKAFRHRIGW